MTTILDFILKCRLFSNNFKPSVASNDYVSGDKGAHPFVSTSLSVSGFLLSLAVLRFSLSNDWNTKKACRHGRFISGFSLAFFSLHLSPLSTSV